jgi:hypothetical protein
MATLWLILCVQTSIIPDPKLIPFCKISQSCTTLYRVSMVTKLVLANIRKFDFIHNLRYYLYFTGWDLIWIKGTIDVCTQRINHNVDMYNF